MKRRFRTPSPALVISLIALFVALGGTSYAAIALPKNSVGTKQLKNNAVTSAKIKNGAVTAAKINTTGLTVPNATNAATAANATELGGQPSSSFASSSAIRFVTIGADGTVVPGESSGVAQANVTHPMAGEYCINGLSPAPKAATISLTFGGEFGAQVFVQPSPALIYYCGGDQIGVAIYDSLDNPADQPVVVAIFS